MICERISSLGTRLILPLILIDLTSQKISNKPNNKPIFNKLTLLSSKRSDGHNRTDVNRRGFLAIGAGPLFYIPVAVNF